MFNRRLLVYQGGTSEPPQRRNSKRFRLLRKKQSEVN